MGELIPDDIWEQILVRLDVEDLIRWKCVCKSWKSLISHPRFGKAHHTRHANLSPYHKAIVPNYLFKYGPEYYMVGSSNGLACITSFDGDEIIVANPWTRQERILKKLRVSRVRSCCWGFGYDALTDDYKVVFGVAESLEKTAFHVLSLKSNVWKHVGNVNRICYGPVQIGFLFNGALQWVMWSVNEQRLISFDLSKEVIKDKAIHESSFLAIKEEYVCIDNNHRGNVWETEKKISVTLCWEKTWCNSYMLAAIDTKEYAFIPTTVMLSLISPYLEEVK